MAQWLGEQRRQAINQVELHPVAAAVATWQGIIKGRDVIFWVDNESARCGLIRGASPIAPSQLLITRAWLGIATSESMPWFARVPSCGNPADDPSRGRVDRLEADGYVRVAF